MVTEKRKLGDMGEAVAAKYLMGKGLKLVDHNVHAPGGELDVIMMDGDLWVFVEVKTRTSHAFGHPMESITRGKLRKIRSAIGHYFFKRKRFRVVPDFRVDVVIVEVKGGKFFCDWYPGVGM